MRSILVSKIGATLYACRDLVVPRRSIDLAGESHGAVFTHICSYVFCLAAEPEEGEGSLVIYTADEHCACDAQWVAMTWTGALLRFR
jgi:hypothetical protein